MLLKYDIEIQNTVIVDNLHRLINQIYKLLPNREEGIDWEKPLTTIMEELAGMDRLLIDQQDILFPLLCKLEGLFTLAEKDDFQLYRRTIFECLSLMNGIVKNVNSR
jgi:hypothetical protein